MFYSIYIINEGGWTTVWPHPKRHFSWSDITKVATFMFSKHYLTVIKFEKDGAICQIKLFAGRNVIWGRLIPVEYYELMKYVCLMLPSEKTCMLTRELAGYDTKFIKDKYRQSEVAYQEVLARQLWLELRHQKALKTCNEILEKDANSFWGMKVKAFVLNGLVEGYAVANNAINIIEEMINLKYYDPFVISLLVELLLIQKSDTDKIDNYMVLFRKQVNYTEFMLEFKLVYYYLDTLRDYQRAENLLETLEPEARKRIDPVYMKYINEFYDKIAKLKAS